MTSVSDAQVVLLGGIAGATIFLGLPVGRTQRLSSSTRALLNALAIGILAPRYELRTLLLGCAALMIQQGAHPKMIQSRLGHSDIRITLNVYGHLFPSLDEDLAEGLTAARDLALRGGAVLEHRVLDGGESSGEAGSDTG